MSTHFHSLAQCVKGLLAFGVFISDGIASHVAIDIIWRTYVVDKIQNHKNALLWEYVLRTAVVILTCETSSFEVNFSKF